MTVPSQFKTQILESSPSDAPEILSFLKEMELFYPGQSMDHFLIYRDPTTKKILGAVQRQIYQRQGEEADLLVSLGVLPEFEGRGLGSSLVRKFLEKSTKDVYLYTVIPDYFYRLGFKDSSDIPHCLPERAVFRCPPPCPEKCHALVFKRQF